MNKNPVGNFKFQKRVIFFIEKLLIAFERRKIPVGNSYFKRV
jgi:hypothetical protein